MATRLPASLAAADWQAGFAAVESTPAGPVAMAGYASRNKPSEGIVADLHAKVQALVDTRGERAVWITTDLIGLRGVVTECILRRVMERTWRGGPGFFSPNAQDVVVSKVKELAARAGRALPTGKS